MDIHDRKILLEVRGVRKYFAPQQGLFKAEPDLVKALDGVSFCLREFQSLGVVGESGCGKTTLVKIILGLIPATSGEILFNKEVITKFRKDVQVVFQNPYNSLDPKMRIRDLIIEPAIVNKLVSKSACNDLAVELIRTVGLDENLLDRLPMEFSGGQRQRICIARSLASRPKLLVLDEPISSLDLTIQAQMLDLFLALKEKLKLTYIFVSHNLAVVKHIADSLVVMHNGRIVEEGSSAGIFAYPKDDYTKLLLKAASG